MATAMLPTSSSADENAPHVIYGRAIRFVDDAGVAHKEQAPGRRPMFVASSGAQREFIESDAPEVIYNADMGGGKSIAGCVKAHRYAMKYAGARCLVLRATAVSCRRTTRDIFRDNFLGPTIFDARWRESDNMLVYPNGSRIIFAGLDDPSSWQSGEFDFAFIDEVIPNLAGGRGINEAEWEAVGWRLRGVATVHQLAGACNAGGKSHWALRRAKEGRLTLIRATPGENDAHLATDYKARRDSATGVARARYVFNEWVSPEGLVVEEFDADVHATRTDIHPPAGIDFPIGIDFGFNHAFATVMGWQCRGQWRIFDEVGGGGGTDASSTRYVGEGSKPNEEWARILNDRWPVNRYYPAYADHSPDGQLTLAKYCPRILSIQNAAKRDELASINTLKALFARRTPEGEPCIIIDPVKCPNLIREIEGLFWKADRGGEIRDQVTDKANDFFDALRYLIHSHTGAHAEEFETPVTNVETLVAAPPSIWMGDSLDSDLFGKSTEGIGRGEVLIGRMG